MIDDSEGLEELVKLQRKAVLSFVRYLINDGHFVKDSPLRNLGLMLGLWIRHDYKLVQFDLEEADWWSMDIVRLADKHAVPIYGPSGIEEVLAVIREGVSDQEETGSIPEHTDPDAPVFGWEEHYAHVDTKELTFAKRWGFLKQVRIVQRTDQPWTLLTCVAVL